MATIDKRIYAFADKPEPLHSHERPTAKLWVNDTEASLKRGHYLPTTTQLRSTVGNMVEKYVDEYLPVKARDKDARKTAALLNQSAIPIELSIT